MDRHWVPIETFADERNPIFQKTPGRVHFTDHMEEGGCEGTPKETELQPGAGETPVSRIVFGVLH